MPPGDLRDLLALAGELAHAAAEMARPDRGRTSTCRKADNSVVTDTDHRIQAHLVAQIARRFPDHAVVAEERLAPDPDRPAPTAAEFCWVIDPLDGTRNFVAGLPCFATSIAVLHHGRPVVGAVREHNLGRLYSATAGGGAALDGEPIRVCEADPAHDFLVGIPSSKDEWSNRLISRWVSDRKLVIRNLGSAAVQLAMVADGALAGMFCRKCKIWDIAAGILLIREAGGKVTDADGRDLDALPLDADVARSLPILAAEPTLHGRLLRTVQEARP
jgi:myo-inositol-1(or 4)-monophosphatase